jgi:hypothetical protein
MPLVGAIRSALDFAGGETGLWPGNWVSVYAQELGREAGSRSVNHLVVFLPDDVAVKS